MAEIAVIPEVSGMQDCLAVAFNDEHIGVSRRMAYVIRSDLYVADGDGFICMVFFEFGYCFEGGFVFLTLTFLRDMLHVGVELLLYCLSDLTEILVNALLGNRSFEGDMVSVVVCVKDCRNAFEKPVEVLRRIIYVIDLAVGLGKVVAEVDKYLGSGSGLYLGDAASYLVDSAVDFDSHLFKMQVS